MVLFAHELQSLRMSVRQGWNATAVRAVIVAHLQVQAQQHDEWEGSLGKGSRHWMGLDRAWKRSHMPQCASGSDDSTFMSSDSRSRRTREMS